MTVVLLTAIAAWLVLSALATVACTLVARGGLFEDRRRADLDREFARLLDAALADDGPPAIPRPRVTAG